MPEVHADGEIWAETLWDLRQALQVKTGSADDASAVAEILVSDGMRVSPPEPSMLDMRNAILTAEQIDFGGAVHDLVWDVFRKRGMGYYAATADGADTSPVEDFLPPPDPNGPKGTVTGVVTDSDSGLPIEGVRVGFGGHASRPEFDDYLADETGADGRYTIEDVPTGTYPKLAFFALRGLRPGGRRERARSPPTRRRRATSGSTRDWSALSGGAEVRTVSDDTGGPFGCGVNQAFDQSQGTGWSAYNPTSEDPGNPQAGPPTVVVELPETIDVSGFLIDPSATCGDGASATTREYTVETSADGTTFQMAVDGRGAAGFTDANIGLLNRRNPTGTTGKAVKFVRLTDDQPAAPGRRLPPDGMLGHGLHRHDGVQGPGRPSEHAADRLARGQQRQPRRRARRSPSRRASPTRTRRSPATTGTSTATGRSIAPPTGRRRSSRTARPAPTPRRSRRRTSAAAPATRAPA